MKEVSKKELEENYRARLRSESQHNLTDEQKKIGEERRAKLDRQVFEELKEEGFIF